MKRMGLTLALAVLLLWLTACSDSRNTGGNAVPSHTSASTLATTRTGTTVDNTEVAADTSSTDSTTDAQTVTTTKPPAPSNQTPISDQEEQEFKDQVNRLIDSLLEGE